MSDGDTFIHEVTEELRRDRLLSLWRRWGPFVLGGVVAAVAAAGYLAWDEQRREAEAREIGGALIQAARAGDPAAQADAYEKIAETAGSGRR